MIRSFSIALLTVILACSGYSVVDGSPFDPGNWSQSIGTSRNIRDVQMLDFNTIIAVGGNRSNDAITSVLRTDDRGQNWEVIMDVPDSPWLQAVHFPTITKGFVAGYDGMVLRTDDGGFSWDTLQLTGNAALRDYNDVYFTSENTGFLVGGHQTNDSIQTILKTTDGGNTWQIVKDELGPWLNAVQFVSATVGFASGASGTILKTVNGGDTWTEISLQGNLANRHYNDIRFSSEMNGIAVGGNLTNDSIRTIIRTQDGGMSWQPVLDNMSPWLNGIDISPSGMIIAVGNDSTILSSDDGGDTWEKVIIPASINWAVNLNAVDFIYGDLGIVVGDYGQMLLYEGLVPNAPVVTINTAVIASPDSIWLSGTVNANGGNTEVYFDYGPTQALGFTMNADPNMVFGSNFTYVEALMTDLTPGIYFYRIRAVNDAGEFHSQLRQFYIGDLYQDINLDFEQWDEETFNLPEGWYSHGVIYSSPSYNGSLAVTLGSGAMDSLSFVLFGILTDEGFIGGLPISVVPDSIVGYFNYDISTGTEGAILVMLKKDGVFLSQDVFTFSGSSSGTFERLSFPISYSGSEIPDTVILGIANNNPFSVLNNKDPYNVVTIDDIKLVSSESIIIPNADFEFWQSIETAQPVGWFSKDLEKQPALNRTIFRTTDAQHGNFAVILKNDMEYNDNGKLRTGAESGSDTPSFPVVGRHATFNGYYKYEMLGVMDTVDVQVRLYQNGLMVGGGNVWFGASVFSYTPFEIELGYNLPSIVPDSANIFIQIGRDTLLGPSVLYLDNFSFDGFVVPYQPLITTIKEAPAAPSAYMVYPNPTDGTVWISSTSDSPISKIAVYSLSGALVHQAVFNSTRAQIDMKDHPAGIYFLQVFSADGAYVQTKKLIRY